MNAAPDDYLQRILNSRVYDVAIERLTPFL